MYLPEGSLGLFRVIAKTKGTSSPHWGLQQTSVSCPLWACFPPLVLYFDFLKQLSVDTRILFSATWEQVATYLSFLYVFCFFVCFNISFLMRSGRSRISLSALPRLSCTPDFQVNLAGQPSGFKADSEHPAPWTMVQTMPWPLFPPAYILCFPQGPFKPPLFLHPSLDSSHTPASGTR